MRHYDVIVIGGGPGGYTAALYTARSGLASLVIEQLVAGGQMALTDRIDNYPGVPDGIDGVTLGQRMRAGAERFGVQTRTEKVVSVQLRGKTKQVNTESECYSARAVIAATGAGYRKLGLPNEELLIGKGVGYCAACDGMFYRDKTVAVIGGGNTAVQSALLLANIAKKVYLIHRREHLRSAQVYRDALEQVENVEFIGNSSVKKFLAEEKLTGLVLQDNLRKCEYTLDVDGVFICIGHEPQTQLFSGQLELDAAGYILADESTRTSLRGVYAVGDVRTKSVRQIVTATADGANAASCIEEDLLAER